MCSKPKNCTIKTSAAKVTWQHTMTLLTVDVTRLLILFVLRLRSWLSMLMEPRPGFAYVD